MSSKHTQGPWFVENGWDEEGKGKYFPTVVISPDSEIDFLRGFVINKSHDQEHGSIMANAHLIAAAPELFEVAEKMQAILASSDRKLAECENTLLGKVTAVIGKAKGEVKCHLN